MFDLHIFSRFLRLVRSICRSLFALFVAIAMLLATFVIAPAYALSAGENGGGRTNTEQTEGAKVYGAGGAKAGGDKAGVAQVKADTSKTVTTKTVTTKTGSAKNDGEKQTQSEPNKTESDKKNTDTSSNLKKNDNKVLKSDTKQQPDSNKAGNKAGNNAKSDDKAKSADKTKSDDKIGKTVEKSAANKKAKDSKKKGADSAEVNGNGTDRSENEEPQLPPECKGKYNTPEKCYSITYYGTKNVKKTENKLDIKGNGNEPYNRVPQIITPTIKVAGKEQKTLPNDVWIGLEKYSSRDDSVKYAFFKGENDKNDSYTAKSTQGVSKSDGSIRFFASKWMAAKTYKFKFVIHYPDGSKSKPKSISEKLDEKDLPKVKPGDLSLSLYDFENADSTAKKDNDNKSVSITIKPKPKGLAPAGSTAGSDDNKDTYDSINKLFIDSQSKDKRGELYHHMICNDGANNYTVDSVNGLSLSNKDGSTTEKQTQFKHMVNEKRPDSGAADSALYEDDKYTEESQSWISGTPTSAGTFECRVFAFKDAKLKRTLAGGKVTESSNLVKEFDTRAETPEGKKSLFEGNIIEDKWKKDSPIQQGVDCDYKSVTIEVKSNKPPKPEPPKISDNDLTLKVYPFKNGDGSLPAELPDKNNKISAILGMSLKPYIDATSLADSANKITLRVLCSKGEKKDSGSQSAQSSGSSQPAQPSESSQDANDLEYKTWSSNLAELGLSVPNDTDQNTCHSNKEGEKTCVSADPSKKVAARTDTEMSIKPSIKPTAVGDYQCVVFALKPDALTKFDDAISKATQSGSLTPTSISSALTSAKPTAFKENKDFATFAFNLHLVSNFTLPNTGGQSWNLQLGILAALLVNLLAAGFVVSQSERARKLILGRWRGLCNYV